MGRRRAGVCFSVCACCASRPYNPRINGQHVVGDHHHHHHKQQCCRQCRHHHRRRWQSSGPCPRWAAGARGRIHSQRNQLVYMRIMAFFVVGGVAAVGSNGGGLRFLRNLYGVFRCGGGRWLFTASCSYLLCPYFAQMKYITYGNRPYSADCPRASQKPLVIVGLIVSPIRQNRRARARPPQF